MGTWEVGTGWGGGGQWRAERLPAVWDWLHSRCGWIELGWEKSWKNDIQVCFLASPMLGRPALAQAEILELEVAIPVAGGASFKHDRPRLGPKVPPEPW